MCSNLTRPTRGERVVVDSPRRSATLTLSGPNRGIDVVRNRIKSFAQKKVTLPSGRHKLVILDEADSMTPGAQQALRRTMEIFSNTTRFAFACNQSNKIIEPIQSRCAILRYARLTDQELLKRLLEICAIEDVRSSPPSWSPRSLAEESCSRSPTTKPA